VLAGALRQPCEPSPRMESKAFGRVSFLLPAAVDARLFLNRMGGLEAAGNKRGACASERAGGGSSKERLAALSDGPPSKLEFFQGQLGPRRAVQEFFSGAVLPGASETPVVPLDRRSVALGPHSNRPARPSALIGAAFRKKFLGSNTRWSHAGSRCRTGPPLAVSGQFPNLRPTTRMPLRWSRPGSSAICW